MSTGGYSEDEAFNRVMESEFSRLAVGKDIPGCGNRPRESLEAQKSTQSPAGVAQWHHPVNQEVAV